MRSETTAQLKGYAQVTRPRMIDGVFESEDKHVGDEKDDSKDKRLLLVAAKIERSDDKHYKDGVGGEREHREEGVQDCVIVEPSNEVSERIVELPEVNGCRWQMQYRDVKKHQLLYPASAVYNLGE